MKTEEIIKKVKKARVAFWGVLSSFGRLAVL